MSEARTREERIVRVQHCRFAAGNERWTLGEEKRAEIDSHWQKRSAQNPGLFNGTIFMLASHLLGADCFEGQLMPVEFKCFLYWKEHGYADRNVRDTFGSALIRSAEGHILLGRQRAGNINAGLAYLPGGFIDGRDVAADGSIDIAASVAREVAEETGLGAGDIERRPGFILTFAGPMLSIAVEYCAHLKSEALAAGIRTRLEQDPNSELEDVTIVREAADLEGLAMPIYAEVLLRGLLAGS